MYFTTVRYLKRKIRVSPYRSVSFRILIMFRKMSFQKLIRMSDDSFKSQRNKPPSKQSDATELQPGPLRPTRNRFAIRVHINNQGREAERYYTNEGI